jgi:hypothetical protein
MNKNAHEKILLENTYASIYNPTLVEAKSYARMTKGSTYNVSNANVAIDQVDTFMKKGFSVVKVVKDGKDISVGNHVYDADGREYVIDEIDTDRDGKVMFIGMDKEGDKVLYIDDITEVAGEDNELNLEDLIASEDSEDTDDEDKLVKVDDETEDAKYFGKDTPE